MPSRKDAKPALTPKQRRFVAEYLVDLNATQAAIRAGYSRNGAEVQGHLLLRNPNIAPIIAEKTQKQLDRCELTGQMVKDRLQ